MIPRNSTSLYTLGDFTTGENYINYLLIAFIILKGPLNIIQVTLLGRTKCNQTKPQKQDAIMNNYLILLG